MFYSAFWCLIGIKYACKHERVLVRPLMTMHVPARVAIRPASIFVRIPPRDNVEAAACHSVNF